MLMVHVFVRGLKFAYSWTDWNMFLDKGSNSSYGLSLIN